MPRPIFYHQTLTQLHSKRHVRRRSLAGRGAGAGAALAGTPGADLDLSDAAPAEAAARDRASLRRGLFGLRLRLAVGVPACTLKLIGVSLVRFVVEIALDHGLKVVDLGLRRLGQDGLSWNWLARARRRP